ncbi:MAG: thioredoxin domain-containing protein [Myxococcales bacterium]|nr:thioredoxin domain-containing protein [Myxococcales bacterium]
MSSRAVVPASRRDAFAGRGLCAALVLILALSVAPRQASAGFDAEAIYQVPEGGAPGSGSDDALVTIVELSDYACTYCVRARATMEALELLYPGQLRWIHRSVPFISESSLAAEAARAAAAQGKHRAMEARLYAVAGRVDRITVELLAQELGLDMLRFRAALDSGAGRAEIAADVELARRLGVVSTPTFFINGRAVLGARPLAAFVEVIDAELARAAALQQQTGLAGRALYERLVQHGRPAGDGEAPGQQSTPELSPYATYRVGTGWPGLSRGPSGAPVTLVVFSDFECQFCAANEAALLHVRKTFGDSVRLVFRHLPLSFHRRAQLAAEAAMAAGAQGKFWEFHDRLFARPGALDRADLEEAALAVGVSMPRFRAELDAHTHRDAVRLDASSGGALGVDGTPTMFVNGLLVSGAQVPARLEETVRAQLEAAKRLVASGIEAGDVYAVMMGAASGRERADPSTIALPRAAQLLQLPAAERLLVATAACRRRQPVPPQLVALPLPLARVAREVCTPYGQDLP